MKLLKNACIITMQSSNEILYNYDILIQDNLIIKIDTNIKNQDYEVYDMTGKIVMPSLVNTHVHLSQQLGRGLADDVDLLTWLEKRIWPYESQLTSEDNYYSSLACMCELIKSGCTTFIEAGGQHVDSMAKALQLTSMRGALSKSTMDVGNCPSNLLNTTKDELAIQRSLVKKYHNTNNNKIKVFYSLRSIFCNTPELITRTYKQAIEDDTKITMHTLEIEDEKLFTIDKYGMSTINYLNSLNVIDERFLAVHSVWLDDNELAIIKNQNASVSHNPAAAMKVSLGFAKIPKMHEMGINITIGTDGAPSNNRMDMWRDMYLASIIFKGYHLNPEIMNAYSILEMATKNGAKVFGEEKLGMIVEGYLADLTVIELDELKNQPIRNLFASLVYTCDSSNVVATMCDGKWLYYNRQLTFIDEVSLLSKIKHRSSKFNL